MTTSRDLPMWRSLLCVPTNVEKFVARANDRGADAVQLDLEDTIPLHEKDNARRMVDKAAERVAAGGTDVLVRVNAPLSLCVRDLEHAVSPHVTAVVCPKIDSASHVRLLDELISELEQKRGLPPGHTRMITIVETPGAFSRCDEIPAASSRVVGTILGGEDFAHNCGMQPDDEVLLYPKQRLIIAARAAGVIPFGFIASAAQFGDLVSFRQMVRRSRRFGFEGAGCIHPNQVPIVNEEYTPSAEEVAKARRILELGAAAMAEGRSSFAMDGRMVDVPVMKRAEALVKRFDAIMERTAARQGG
jgi:citrate lyase subunit beta/citryl-CoA lyase